MYIALFSCVTRAIQLELVQNSSAAAFRSCLTVICLCVVNDNRVDNMGYVKKIGITLMR